jgi:hypothetical protein
MAGVKRRLLDSSPAITCAAMLLAGWLLWNQRCELAELLPERASAIQEMQPAKSGLQLDLHLFSLRLRVLLSVIASA